MHLETHMKQHMHVQGFDHNFFQHILIVSSSET